MPISVSRYIYSLKSGKKTDLASSLDVSTTEKQQIKSYNIGSISDPDYLQSLWPKPSYGVIPLSSGRIAVLRILPPTNIGSVNAQYQCFAILIKSENWISDLCCDIETILFTKQLWSWNHKTDLPKVEIPTTPPLFGPDDDTRQHVLSILAQLESNSHNPDFRIIINEKYTDQQLFRWLNILLPQNTKKKFSYFSRSLNPNLQLTVISLPADIKSNKNPDICIWKPGTKQPYNTPYTDHIKDLWQPGKMPPVSHIQKIQDFSKPIAKPDQPEIHQPTNAREKILTYLAQNPIKQPKYKKYPKVPLSLNRIIVLTVAAIIVFSAAAFSALWVRHKVIVYKYDQQAQQFLDKYPLTMVFESQIPIDPLIEENLQLTDSIQRYINKTKTDRLNPVQKRLLRWQTQALQASDQKTQLADIFTDIQQLRLENLPTTYPQPSLIIKIDDYRQKLKEIQNNFVLPSPQTINELQTRIQQIDKFNSAVTSILNDYKSNTQLLKSEFDELQTPRYYSQDLLQQHQSFLEDIADIQQTPGISNAIVSPRQNDALTAVESSDILDDLQKKTENRIKTINTYYINASNFIDTFNFQYQLATTNPTGDLAERLKQLQLLLTSVKKFWPDNPQIPLLEEKQSNIITLDKLNQYSDRLDQISTDIIDSNSLNEQTIENFQQNLDDLEMQTENITSDMDLIQRTKDDIFDSIENLQSALAQKLLDIEKQQEQEISDQSEQILPDANDIN